MISLIMGISSRSLTHVLRFRKSTSNSKM